MKPLPIIDRQSDRPLAGVLFSQPSPGAVERIGADWDWVFIDGQHGDANLSQAIDLLRAADLIDRPALVRLPAHDPGWVLRILDAGAAGVIIPMVEDREEAQAMIQAAKFPPLGNRSYGGRRIIDRAGRGYYRTANRDTLLILQVESKEAVAQAGDFAAMEGVDGLFLGPADLVIRLGLSLDAAQNADAIGRPSQEVAEQCLKHGKLSLGMAVTDSAREIARRCGYRLVVGGSDLGLVAGGSKTRSQALRSFFAQANPSPLLGLHIVFPGPGTIERVGQEWDWVWIDAQHGDLNMDQAIDLIRAADLVGKPGLVRIPAHDPGWILRMLDGGAAGVIVPMVESVSEAGALVRAAKFPPVGNRSYGGRRVIDRIGRAYHKSANKETCLILQVESAAAVALASDLAALDGVDGLFLGPADLSLREGRDLDSPETRDILEEPTRKVAESCRKFGKRSVCIGVSPVAKELARDYRYDLVVGGGAASFLASGSKAAAGRLRDGLAGQTPVSQAPVLSEGTRS